MKGQTYQGSPPGYVSLTNVVRRLHMSRQNFHQSGLATAIDRWRIGRVTLYSERDVDLLANWLTVRQGLIALGYLHNKAPLNPDENTYYLAVHEGYWDAQCPQCEGYAIAHPLEGPVWCPSCGLAESKEPLI